MFIISCQGRYFSAIIYGNGYVFMEILQSLIIFDAIYSKTFSYNHEKRVLHDYKKKWYEKVSLKKGHWK